jgi:hypothetical protein
MASEWGQVRVETGRFKPLRRADHVQEAEFDNDIKAALIVAR